MANCKDHALLVAHEQSRIKSRKLSTTPYNPRYANEVCDFIDVSFIPFGKADKDKYEGGKLDDADLDGYAEGELPGSFQPWVSQTTIKLPPKKPCHQTHSSIRKVVQTEEPDDDNDEIDESEPKNEDDGCHVFCSQEFRTEVVDMLSNAYNAAPHSTAIYKWAVQCIHQQKSTSLYHIWQTHLRPDNRSQTI